MAVQLSVTARNARLDAIETTIGATAHLHIYTGAQPASCAAVDSGTELEDMTLPADYMSAAASGQKTKLGTWTGTADAAGAAGHFRMKDSTSTTCHMQGSITGTGGGGDMELNNTSISSGQTITVDTFTLTDGNA